MIQKLIRQLAQENLDEQVVENPYCHMASVFDEGIGKICRKDVRKKILDRLLGAEKGYVVLDEKKGHYQKEGSATTIWSALEGVTFMPLLWNIFPFHPYKAGNKRTNRTPTAKEMAQGVRYVRDLLAIFDSIEQIYALGRKYVHPASGKWRSCDVQAWNRSD